MKPRFDNFAEAKAHILEKYPVTISVPFEEKINPYAINELLPFNLGSYPDKENNEYVYCFETADDANAFDELWRRIKDES